MTHVPPGWRRTTMGELGRYLNGRGFKKSEWGSVGRPIIRIQNLTGTSDSFNYYQGELDERHIVRTGDLLVSWAATLGAYFWQGVEGALNQHIFKVESNIDPRFHKYLLDHKLAELRQHTHGSGMVHITRGRFDSIEVAVPQITEQRRIVDLVEDHLSRLDAGASDLEKAAARLANLRLARLTEWRRASANVGSAQVGVIADTTLGKMLDAKRQTGEPTTYLRNINVRWGSFDLDDLRSTMMTEAEVARLDIRPGDIMVCEGGEPGRCAVWNQDVPGLSFQKALHRVRVKDAGEVLPDFVAMMLTEAIKSGRHDHLFTGTTIKHLPQEKLRAIEIALPALDEQRRAVQADLVALDHEERLQVAIREATGRQSALRRALLAVAFSGRLTGSASDLDRAEELLDA